MPHPGLVPDNRGRYPPERISQKTNAYLVGGGIASLSAACLLLHEARVPASQIHILESSSLPGGSMDGSGNPEKGYVIRGGRMLNFSYRCLYELLSHIPSLSDPKVTVMDEIINFNAVPGNKTHANARLATRAAEYPNERLGFADARDFELKLKDRIALIKLTAEPEERLERTQIQDHFEAGFFKTNFWIMWATMFAFQPWHSAKEFQRYLHRFLQELPRINTLEGVDRTPYNQYDSIILPITKYLMDQGVDFRYDTKVLRLSYVESKRVTVNEIHIAEAGFTGVVNVHETDIVIITLGSMTACSAQGSNDAAPSSPFSTEYNSHDGSWELWKSISQDHSQFGHPDNFTNRIRQSHWESFTVTLKSPELFQQLVEYTHNAPGTGALTSFKDSNWLLSIVVPHQPHFISQPADVQVFWGYALYPTQPGNFVKKPMIECSGKEILTELLGHLRFPTHPILENAITIPTSMPFITSQFLTRSAPDRPKVIPSNTTNLAFIGQFVEIPLDVVFTVEYSVRGAMMAVYELMGLKQKPKEVYKGGHHPAVLLQVLKTMLNDGVSNEDQIDLPNPKDGDLLDKDSIGSMYMTSSVR